MQSDLIPFPGFALRAAGRQIVGQRERQEDSFRLYPSDTASRMDVYLVVLSDGMGGMGDGAEASKNIVQAYVSAYATSSPGELVQPVQQANLLLKDMKEKKSLAAGAGGTFIGLEVSKEGYRFISIGDSLLYLQRDQKVTRLNKSHNWEWELARRVKHGEMTQEEADAVDTPRHALYAAVCGEDIPAADVSPLGACKPGDRFILASDGILPLQRLEWESLLNSRDIRGLAAEAACDALLERLEALNAPKQDNATIVIVDILPEEAAQPDAPAKWMWSAESLLGDRPDQQDAERAWVSPYASLAVVADGVGGHIGGAQASAKAAEVLEKAWNDRLCRGVTPVMAENLLKTAIHDAHRAVLEMSGGNPERSGKCAYVAAYLCDGAYTVVNVGDCRAYLSSRGKWKLLTHDDSLLQILLDQGQVEPQDAVNHPDQGVLTQAIGGSSDPKPHVFHGTYEDHQSFLLCCDGLWNQLPEQEMRGWNCEPTKAAHDLLLKDKAAAAVRAKNGKSDNVSAVWLYSDRKEPFPWEKLQFALLATAVVCIVIGLICALSGNEEQGGQIPDAPPPTQPVNSGQADIVQQQGPEQVQSQEPEQGQSQEPEQGRQQEPEQVQSQEPEQGQQQEPEQVQSQEPDQGQQPGSGQVQSQEPDQGQQPGSGQVQSQEPDQGQQPGSEQVRPQGPEQVRPQGHGQGRPRWHGQGIRHGQGHGNGGPRGPHFGPNASGYHY